jgi:hypothetical protein
MLSFRGIALAMSLEPITTMSAGREETCGYLDLAVFMGSGFRLASPE